MAYVLFKNHVCFFLSAFKKKTNKHTAPIQHVWRHRDFKQETAVALVDLPAAHDTVWHQGLRLKLLRTIPDKDLVAYIMETLSNRRFVLRTSDGQESRARRLKNGVAQVPIPAPCLLNIYISDIPKKFSTNLHYADD